VTTPIPRPAWVRDGIYEQQGVFPMKCVVIQDARNLQPKDNKEANLGILEFVCFLHQQKNHRKGMKFVSV
jgi:hypothetical protein